MEEGCSEKGGLAVVVEVAAVLGGVDPEVVLDPIQAIEAKAATARMLVVLVR